MMKYLVLNLIICFSILSCTIDKVKNKSIESSEVQLETETESDNLFSIDIAQAIKDVKKGKIPLSELGSSIEYIPLETNSESLFGGGRHGLDVEVVSDKVILMNMKRFDRQTGRYQGELMKKGEGPGEYSWVRGGLADDEREEYYLHDWTKMQIHRIGYDGIFKESIPCGDNVKVSNFGEGKLLLVMDGPLSFSYNDFRIMDVDSKETLLARRSSVFQNIQSMDECNTIFKGKNGYWRIGRNSFWQYGDKFRYYDCLTDSVYTITKDLKVIPTGVFKMDDLRLTKEQESIGIMSRNFFTWYISKILETSDMMYISVSAHKSKPVQEAKYYIIVYSKKDKTVQTYHNENVFENDLDNTLSFNPILVQCTSYFYRLLSIDAIKEREDKPFTEKGRRFKEMASKLKFDDNDVVAILK